MMLKKSRPVEQIRGPGPQKKVKNEKNYVIKINNMKTML